MPTPNAEQAREARRRGADATLELVQRMLNDAIETDFEHGVKWLNEQSARDFRQNFPSINKAIAEILSLWPSALASRTPQPGQEG
jgi:hypothetical protein